MTGVDIVYLARHGRTALNADGRLRGLSDPPLDAIGIAEARKLADVLATKHPALVITSPLQRAVTTGRAIASAAGCELRVDNRLNDRDYGPWTGRPRADVEQRFGSVDAAPGVEPADTLAARAYAAFIALVAEHSGPLVLVSHDAFNCALLRELDPALGDPPQRTACWNQLSRTTDGWHVDAVDRKPT